MENSNEDNINGSVRGMRFSPNSNEKFKCICGDGGTIESNMTIAHCRKCGGGLDEERLKRWEENTLKVKVFDSKTGSNRCGCGTLYSEHGRGANGYCTSSNNKLKGAGGGGYEVKLGDIKNLKIKVYGNGGSNGNTESKECKYGHSFIENSLNCLQCGKSRVTTTDPLPSPQNTEMEEWERKYREEFNEIWEPLFDVSSWKEIGNKVKEFNLQFIDSHSKKLVSEYKKELIEKIEKSPRYNFQGEPRKYGYAIDIRNIINIIKQ